MLILGLFFSLAVSVGAGLSQTEEMDKVDFEELEHVGSQIVTMEEEINQAGKAVEEKYEEQINALMQRTTTLEESSPEIDSIKQAMQKERNEAEKAILEKYGFASSCPSNESNGSLGESVLRSPATNITFSETPVTYDKNAKIYRYTVDWTFKQQDSLWDTYDIAGVGMTNSNQYTIYKSFAKTFTNYGVESCYVDDRGNSHPSKSI